MFTETSNIQKSRAVLQRLATCCVMLVCLFVTTLAFAKDYSFTWSANPEPVEGYKLYYKIDGAAVPPFDGTGSLQGPSPIDVGKQTAFTITGLDDNTTYFFALTAYDGVEESGFSEIISVFAPEIAPVAIIVTPSSTGNAPFTLNLDGTSSTGAISTYSWTFGDGESATGPTASHIYQFPGTYTATLAVENTSGLSHQATILVTVTETAPPPPVPTNPTAVISLSNAAGNAPLTVQFNGSASTTAQPPIVSYSWDFGDGTALAGGAAVTHTYSAPGPYHPVLTVTDNAGLTGQATVLVTATEPAPPPPAPVNPTAVISSSNAVGNAPLTVQFDGSASTTAQPPIVSYSWNFGDGTALAGGATVAHTYSTPGPYHPVLTITDNAGLTGQAGIDITVTEPAPPPPAPVNPTAVISSSNAVGNAPLTVQFDGSASTSAQPPIVSYSWDFGDGAIAGGATVAHSYTIPGTYSAVLTITDNAGLTSQAKTPVMIGAAPLPEVIPPISSFIATPSSGTSPLKVAFNASGSSAPAGSISEYRWDFGDGTSAIGITPKHTFVAKANYLVTLKVTDNLGGTATSSETVSVLKLVKKESTDKEDNVITPILYLLLLK